MFLAELNNQNLRLAMFLAELNKQMLEMHTYNHLQKKNSTLWVVLNLKNYKDMFLLYTKQHSNTRSGGACSHDKLFDILHQIGFKPSKADPDIWMKSSKDDNHYEYNAVYVDDLAICMKDPKAFCDTLKEKYKLKQRSWTNQLPSWMWI